MLSPWLLIYLDGEVLEMNARVLERSCNCCMHEGGKFEITDDTALVADSGEKLCCVVSEFDEYVNEEVEGCQGIDKLFMHSLHTKDSGVRDALSKLFTREGGAGADGAILPSVVQLISTLKIGADCCQLCQYKLTKPDLQYIQTQRKNKLY